MYQGTNSEATKTVRSSAYVTRRPEPQEVSGHDFSRAAYDLKMRRALAPVMSKPSRPSDPNDAKGEPRTFFVTTRTAGGKSLFQTQRMADLFIDVLRSYVRGGKFTIHDFVVMPNHVHILMTVPGRTTIERTMQLIKGNFSFRAKKELTFSGAIWQRGFSDVRIIDEESFSHHREYINNNPVRAGRSNSPEEYPFGSAYLKNLKRAGAKALAQAAVVGTTEVVP